MALCLVKQGFGQRSPDERGDTAMEFKDLVVTVLAGNDENPDLLGGSGQPSKFFMPFGHEMVGDRVLRAVDGLNCCKSIYLAVPLGSAKRQDFTTERRLHLVSEGATRTESVMNTVREAERQGDYVGGDYVLVITGDLPLLSSLALDRLIEACEGADEADLYLGMIPYPPWPRSCARRIKPPFCPTAAECTCTQTYVSCGQMLCPRPVATGSRST